MPSRRSSPLASFSRIVLILGCLAAIAAPAAAADHYIGLGALFFRTVDDIEDDGFSGIEDDGFAYLGSYTYDPQGIFRFQIDVEYYGDGFGGSPDSAVTPLGYVIVGGNLYLGVGAGVVISDGFPDGDDVSDPFYAARLGFILGLLPGVGLDLNLNYRADAFSELDQVDTDALTFAAMVRFKI